MTAVIITGGIDLSVGAVLVLSGMVIGMTMHAGMSIWLAVPLALGVALLVGAINGVLVAYVGVPPFVVTLGMLSIARSLAMVLSGNTMVYEFGPDQPKLLALGGGFLDVGSVRIPNPVILLLVLLVLAAFVFRWTRWGRHLFAIGGNEQAARMTGVPVNRIKFQTYVFSAFTATVASLLLLGYNGSAINAMGTGYELRVIAATVIGGASLMGGAGTAYGAFIGSAFLEVIRNALLMAGIDSNWQGAFVGAFIILAVLLGMQTGATSIMAAILQRLLPKKHR